MLCCISCKLLEKTLNKEKLTQKTGVVHLVRHHSSTTRAKILSYFKAERCSSAAILATQQRTVLIYIYIYIYIYICICVCVCVCVCVRVCVATFTRAVFTPQCSHVIAPREVKCLFDNLRCKSSKVRTLTSAAVRLLTQRIQGIQA